MCVCVCVCVCVSMYVWRCVVFVSVSVCGGVCVSDGFRLSLSVCLSEAEFTLGSNVVRNQCKASHQQAVAPMINWMSGMRHGISEVAAMDGKRDAIARKILGRQVLLEYFD